MVVRIGCQMSDEQIIQSCRDELDAARAIPGCGVDLVLEFGADEKVMRLITREPSAEQSANESFEIAARAFQDASGYIAPGKNGCCHTMGCKHDWKVWCAAVEYMKKARPL